METVTKVDRIKLYTAIIKVLEVADLTAHEVAEALHRQGVIPYSFRQMVAPRITELERMNRVEVVGIKIDAETKKTVRVYRKTGGETCQRKNITG